jgi:hypothetical protein
MIGAMEEAAGVDEEQFLSHSLVILVSLHNASIIPEYPRKVNTSGGLRSLSSFERTE